MSQIEGGARSVTDSLEQCKRKAVRSTFSYGSEVIPVQYKLGLSQALYSPVHTTQTSLGSAQVFGNLGMAHANVDAKNLGSA